MRALRSLTLGGGLVAALLFVAAPAHAHDAGCGLGTMMWSGQSGMGFKLFASTTNGWFGTQTLGITLGTSGCSQGGAVASAQQLQMFVGSNLDQIARDMAVGDGETLQVIATLLEVAPDDRDAFYRLTQARFAEVFPSAEVTSGDVVTSLTRLAASVGS